jgi:xylulose-5-phosphate/fructose-6-phosphate phosphoketolase
VPTALSDDELGAIDAYWRAANYLTVGQIYLEDNALLREPLRPEHIKPRLLGHWGTSPGLSLLYVHLNRVIRERDADVIFITGPGHGGPAVLANVYLEGTYSEIYPVVTSDADGLHRLFRQFSTPGGVPSHVSVPTPGSIHEGGELGYALVHAYGAAFDNPELLVACVIGDGEAETGALEASWKGTRFLNPERDGAVLPILHLNEHKISGPTVLGRATDERIANLLRGHGHQPMFIEGHEVPGVHSNFDATLAEAHRRIRAIQDGEPSAWPALVLRTPKGWTGPAEVDGVPIEGTFRAHQVPLAGVRENAKHLELLESWLRRYRPDEHFDVEGRLRSELADLAPEGDKRMGASAFANGGPRREPLATRELGDYEVPVKRPGESRHENTRPLGELTRDLLDDNRGRFRLFCPDETNSNRLGAVFEVEDRCLMDALPEDDHVSVTGRVMEVLSEHLCQGWLEGYTLTGRHGLFATYEAFAMVSASMAIQHAKWLEAAEELEWREPVPSLNVLLTSTCWRNDHNGFSHQGPGLIDTMIALRGSVVRVYLPADANTLIAVADHCLQSHNYVNLLVADKQSHLQYLDLAAAREHAANGASVWNWAGSGDEEPDVILASIGDVPTLEALAAAALLRERVPELRFRFVNVVDLMRLPPSSVHPHGLSNYDFEQLFGADREVVVAFHGYARALHQLLHGRRHPGRFHVRGFNEQGTTTTPFDMTVLNGMSRFHLAAEAIRRAPRRVAGGAECIEQCDAMLHRHRRHVRERFEDLPEIRDWVWPG